MNTSEEGGGEGWLGGYLPFFPFVAHYLNLLLYPCAPNTLQTNTNSNANKIQTMVARLPRRIDVHHYNLYFQRICLCQLLSKHRNKNLLSEQRSGVDYIPFGIL